LPVHHITYMSSATRALSPEELGDLLRQAQVLNERNQITGLLMYHNRSFVQTIEGPAPELRETMDRIRLDVRHHGIIMVENRERPDREFMGWTMAFQADPSWTPKVGDAYVPLTAVTHGQAPVRRDADAPLSPYLHAFLSSFRDFAA
jgi:hypothetical protein